MTAPLPAGPQVTIPYAITPGAPAVRITDGAGNTPAGLTLVNRADHGGTVWVSSGPAGAAVPLGPGGSLQWTDPGTFPYATVTGAGAAETIVVTNQSGQYANPAAVAAATATQLAAQGVPSVLQSTGLGTYLLPTGGSSAGINVGAYASLVVSVSWPQPTPVGRNVLQLTADDPAVPDLPATRLYLTADNAAEQTSNVWQVPVTAARLTLTNRVPTDANNASALVSVVGTNRAAPAFRMVGGELGVAQFYRDPLTVAAGGRQSLLPNPAGGSPCSRLRGRVTVEGTAAVAGGLRGYYIDATGTEQFVQVRMPAGVFTRIDLNHPVVPVSWGFVPDTTGGYIYVSISQS